MRVNALFRVLEVTHCYDGTRSYKLAPTNEKREGEWDPVHASFWTATPSGSMELFLGTKAPSHDGLLVVGRYVGMTFRHLTDLTPLRPQALRTEWDLQNVQKYTGGFAADLQTWSRDACADLFGASAGLGNGKLRLGVSNLGVLPFFEFDPHTTPGPKVLIDFEPA